MNKPDKHFRQHFKSPTDGKKMKQLEDLEEKKRVEEEERQKNAELEEKKRKVEEESPPPFPCNPVISQPWKRKERKLRRKAHASFPEIPSPHNRRY